MNRLNNASFTVGYLSALLAKCEATVQGLNPNYQPRFQDSQPLCEAGWATTFRRNIALLYFNCLFLPSISSTMHPVFAEALYQLHRIELPSQLDMEKWDEGYAATKHFSEPLLNEHSGFGERIAAVRKIASLTQSSLAQITAISQPNIAREEVQNKPHMRIETIRILADGIQCSIELLLQCDF